MHFRLDEGLHVTGSAALIRHGPFHFQPRELTADRCHACASTHDLTSIVGGPGKTERSDFAPGCREIERAGPDIGALTRCRLDLVDAATKAIDSNLRWNPALASLFPSVGAFPLPAGSDDAALLETLPGSAYTARLGSPDDSPGVGIAEIYEVR